MAKSLFDELGGKYERQGNYLLPCLTVPAEEKRPIGIWHTAPKGRKHPRMDRTARQHGGRRKFCRLYSLISTCVLDKQHKICYA